MSFLLYGIFFKLELSVLFSFQYNCNHWLNHHTGVYSLLDGVIILLAASLDRENEEKDEF